MSLYNRVKEVMVDYSAATTNNQIGRVGPKKLQRAFVDDAKMSRALRQGSTLKKLYSVFLINHKVKFTIFKLDKSVEPFTQTTE